jgi:hypothetical protein
VIILHFSHVDMQSKYNMMKSDQLKVQIKLPVFRGLERAPSFAGVKRHTSEP